MEDMNVVITEFYNDSANAIDEITANYSIEERLAFLQGVLTMIQLIEGSAKIVLVEEGKDEDDEKYLYLMGSIDSIKQQIVEIAKEL